MNPRHLALGFQFLLLAYHQATTFLDLFPFNGARFYSRRERSIEMGVNAMLMGLAIAGSLLGSRALMLYGAIYYTALFAMELVIWWVPYFVEPRGGWRALYNRVLAVGTSDFEPGDTLARWQTIYERIHARTFTPLPQRPGRITPNLEHTFLHAATLATALITWLAWRG